MHQPTRHLLCLIFCLVTWPAWCKPPINPAHQLARLKQHLHTLQENLSVDQQRHDQVLTAIQKTDLSIQKLALAMRDTQHQISLKHQERDTLAKQITTHQQHIDQERTSLAKQLRLIYMLGEHNYLKIILDQTALHDTNRMLTYGQYLNRYRLHSIHDIRSHLAELERAQQQAATVQQQLQTLARAQREEKTQLIQEQAQRQQLIQRIQHTMVTRQAHIQQMKADAKRLTLAMQQAEHASHAQPNRAFAKSRGRLRWPLQGKVTGRFGEPLAQGYMKRMGIVIAAPNGTPIQAVATGRVAYAGWLKGFGLLLIVNHGQGYMSVYAHNNTLYHRVGDTVMQGDIVATAGQSGGFAKPGLYFAIRHNGQAVDPMRWLSH